MQMHSYLHLYNILLLSSYSDLSASDVTFAELTSSSELLGFFYEIHIIALCVISNLLHRFQLMQVNNIIPLISHIGCGLLHTPLDWQVAEAALFIVKPVLHENKATSSYRVPDDKSTLPFKGARTVPQSEIKYNYLLT